MKNSIKIVFLNEVIHPVGRVILLAFKKCLFQFPGPAVYAFFRGVIYKKKCIKLLQVGGRG